MPLAPGLPIPAALQTLAFAGHPYRFLRALGERYGDTCAFDLLGEGTIVLFSAPEAVKETFRLPPAELRSANETVSYLLDPRSVIFLEGEEHHTHRRLMSPPFEGRALEGYAPAILRALDAATRDVRDGAELALAPVLQRATFDALLGAILGLEPAPRWEPLREELLAFVNGQLTAPMFFAALVAGSRLRGRLERGAAEAKARLRRGEGAPRVAAFARRSANLARVELLLEELVAERRRAPTSGGDVLSRFAAHCGPTQVSDRDVVQELLTLLIAGHDTTSLALSWAIVRCLQRPEVIDRLRDELRPAVTPDGVDPAAVGQCAYLDAVVTESLRLDPVAAFAPRRSTRDLTIGGTRLPAGTRFAANVIGAHHRVETWGDPLAFRPERFLGAGPSPTVFLPFGGGYRRCVGAAFARYEMGLVLARLFTGFSLALPRGYRATPSVHGFLIGPRWPVRVRASRRAS